MKALLAILIVCLVSIGAAVPMFESSGNVHGYGQGQATMYNPYVPFYYNFNVPVGYNYFYGSTFPYYYAYWFYWR